MAKIAVLFGAALIAVGLAGYLGTPTEPSGQPAAVSDASDPGTASADSGKPKRSITALIPAFVGIPILVCGLIAFKESARKHAMHVAVAVGLLGFLAGGYKSVDFLGKALQPDAEVNWRSFTFVLLMTLICATFVSFCVNSFVQARRDRKELEAASRRQTPESD